MTEKPLHLTPKRWYQALLEAGIIQESCASISIELDRGNLILRIEQYADERLLTLVKELKEEPGED